jgi:2-oxo-4-hydroxy-4-carboxy-5-ureidoimidazoline decarboxylase
MVSALSSINQLQRSEFVALLGPVFEETPAIAEAAWSQRPFVSKAALHGAMVEVMRSLPSHQQLKLICAHPDLGSRAPMAPASVQEQAAVGLNQSNASELAELQRLNQAYRDRFGFPFIIAVKQQTKQSIFISFEERLQNSAEVEQVTALEEIAKIAWLRLEDLVQDDLSQESSSQTELN